MTGLGWFIARAANALSASTNVMQQRGVKHFVKDSFVPDVLMRWFKGCCSITHYIKASVTENCETLWQKKVQTDLFDWCLFAVFPASSSEGKSNWGLLPLVDQRDEEFGSNILPEGWMRYGTVCACVLSNRKQGSFLRILSSWSNLFSHRPWGFFSKCRLLFFLSVALHSTCKIFYLRRTAGPYISFYTPNVKHELSVRAIPSSCGQSGSFLNKQTSYFIYLGCAERRKLENWDKREIGWQGNSDKWEITLGGQGN